MKNQTFNRTTLFLFLVAAITACTRTGQITEIQDGPPAVRVDIDRIPDPAPRFEPKSPGGNPESYVVLGQRYRVLPESTGFVQRGIASWYGRKFHGRKTSNGEIFDMLAMTAAHKSLPLPTYVRVTNLENNRRVVVRVNDRGPFQANRIIDLSYVAAAKLDIHKKGTGFVEIQALTDPSKYPRTITTNQPPPEKKIYLQVGAFADKNNAVRLRESVNLPHFPASRIAEGAHQEKPLFRVQLGPIFSVAEVDKITEHLAILGITDIRFIVEEAIGKGQAMQ